MLPSCIIFSVFFPYILFLYVRTFHVLHIKLYSLHELSIPIPSFFWFQWSSLRFLSLISFNQETFSLKLSFLSIFQFWHSHYHYLRSSVMIAELWVLKQHFDINCVFFLIVYFFAQIINLFLCVSFSLQIAFYWLLCVQEILFAKILVKGLIPNSLLSSKLKIENLYFLGLIYRYRLR